MASFTNTQQEMNNNIISLEGVDIRQMNHQVFSNITLKKYYNFKFKPQDTLLFGRESSGVPEIVHNNSYQRLRIPLKKNA